MNYPKMVAWTGICEVEIIRLSFCNDNLTSESYLELMQIFFDYLEDVPISQQEFFVGMMELQHILLCVRLIT